MTGYFEHARLAIVVLAFCASFGCTSAAMYACTCNSVGCTCSIDIPVTRGSVFSIDVETIDLDQGTESIELIIAGNNKGVCASQVGNTCGRFVNCLNRYVVQPSDISVTGTVNIKLRASPDVSNDCQGLAVNGVVYTEDNPVSRPSPGASPGSPIAPSSVPTTCTCLRGTCVNGGCVCHRDVVNGFWDGVLCDSCLTNYYGLQCNKYCNPALSCSSHGFCSSSGECVCAQSTTMGYWSGTDCKACAPDYFGPSCNMYCKADRTCSGNGLCQSDGTCTCIGKWNGTQCDQCSKGYYGPQCALFCDDAYQCNGHGTCTFTTARRCACLESAAQGHWDPSTDCATCQSGFSYADLCRSVDLRPLIPAPSPPTPPQSSSAVLTNKSDEDKLRATVVGLVVALCIVGALLVCAIIAIIVLACRCRDVQKPKVEVVERYYTPTPNPVVSEYTTTLTKIPMC